MAKRVRGVVRCCWRSHETITGASQPFNGIAAAFYAQNKRHNHLGLLKHREAEATSCNTQSKGIMLHAHIHIYLLIDSYMYV